MKWFTKNHLRIFSLSMLLTCTMAAFLLPQNTFAMNRYDGGYGYGGYNNNYYPPQNYNYNQQYYLSPYMTSTQPYPVNGYSYPYYSSNYYPNNYYDYGNYNNYYNQMYVSCTVNKPYAMQSEPVTWSAYVSGGSGGYNYLWNGTDNPQSLNASSINVSYGNSGMKSMSVTVWSNNGQSSTAYCGQTNIGYYQYQNPYYYGSYMYPQY